MMIDRECIKYSVFSELQREIVGTQNPSKILDYTNRFSYTLVLHDFDDETKRKDTNVG